MPYIKQEQREKFDELAKELASRIETPGDFNYIITVIAHELFGDKVSYTKGNELIGVLECCKLELYRAVLAGYENSKIEESGFVSKIDKEFLKMNF